jgi:plasmid maintenance system antidote protein VapI
MEGTRQGPAEPLDELRTAVRNAGGPSAVARKARVNRTHLANVLGGTAPVGKDVAARLRPHIILGAETWLELLAPLEQAPADPSTEATP